MNSIITNVPTVNVPIRQRLKEELLFKSSYKGGTK